MSSGTGDLFLATKLFPPGSPTALLRRPRLVDLLGESLTVPLTLVAAPAGWGKSSLVSDWTRTGGVRSGWVSLDRGDSDPMRFWQYLLRAADHAGSAAAALALRRLEAAGSAIERDVLPVFINTLLADPDPLVVVLDDYHQVTHPEVHESLTLLLERCPPSLHLIIITRADPPLPLSRLRLAGRMIEIRAHDLAFSIAEARTFFQGRTQAQLSDGDVGRLVERTEGWAAGLRLASLRLRDRPDARDFVERFTGADRAVVDYLGEEVLSALPTNLLTFLMQTSVLDRLNAPLCDAVTGRTDARDMLDEIDRADLFLIPLDEQRRWYRYHHLFGGLLRHELERTSPDARSELHGRAARWYAQSGEHTEAVRHALASNDDALAAACVERAWRAELNAGRWETVRGWLAALPADLVATRATLSVARVWVGLDSGRLTEVAQALQDAEARGPADTHLLVLHALYDFKIGDLDGAATWLSKAPPAGGDAFVATVQNLVGGLVALWSGRLDAAAGLLDQASTRARDDGNRLADIYAQGCRALVAIESGDPIIADRLIRDADQQVTRTLSSEHFIAMFPMMARARLGLPDGAMQAHTDAAVAVELGRRGASRIELAAALLTAAAASAATAGSDPQAQVWLSEARGIVRLCPDAGPMIASWMDAEQRRTPAPTGAAHLMIEPLTERELDILRLLPRQMSQRELADSLFVTPNTLKTHLRAIYRKLGAASRGDAVVRARSQGLI